MDLLAELTAAKEIVAEAALEKAKEALPGKPVETPAAEPALVEATPEEQPKSTRRRVTSAKKSAVKATPVEQPKPARRRRTTSVEKSAADVATAEQSKTARKRRAPAEQPPARRAPRASFILYNCDEAKSPELCLRKKGRD